MTVLTPPGYTQGGTYSAKLDRMYIGTVGYVPNLAASFSARQGFHSGRGAGIAVTTGMEVSISACSAVIANTFASASGDYLMVNDGAVNLVLAASSPTQNRHDIIGFQVKDNLFDSSGLNTAVPAVIQGANSAGTPSDPALPASFIPVARAVVNAGVTSPTLVSLVRRTASNGGVVRISNVTERAEIAPFEGYPIWREDRDWLEIYDGGAWRVQGVAVCASTADRDSAITNPYNGQLAVTLDTYTVWVRRSGVWERFPRGLIVRSRRVTPSAGSGSSTAVGVRRVDNIAGRAGQALTVETSTLHPTSTNPGDNIRVEIRYSTSGVATTASPVLPGAQAYEAFGNTTNLKTTYTPVGNETISLLLCVARDTGVGTATLYADATLRFTEIYVRDEGVDPGNTGTDV
jgi:hypothetical protein